MTEPTIPTILVVDDSVIALHMVNYHLRETDYDIVFVRSGEEALRRIDAIQPDIVLLDVVMPEMDGYEVCRELRQNPAWQDLQIIMLTSLDETDSLLEGLDAGADEFLPKPLNGEVLRAYIVSALRRKQKVDDLQLRLEHREKMAAMIVHDMRNPISAMQINSQLLQRKMVDSVDSKYLERIQSQTRYLQRFTNDLLALSQADDNALNLKCQPVDLLDLIQTVINDYQEAAHLRQITLKLDLPASAPTVTVDPALMRRLIENLVQNAIKFSPMNTAITISADFTAGADPEFTLNVTDEGTGISPTYRERIFEQYEISQLKNEGVHQIGLGLAFCKMVTEQHGGQIFVTDNPNGNGSRFVVRI